ncbi:MAG: DUF1800 domain-containing protein [Chloroflexota bacterium]
MLLTRRQLFSSFMSQSGQTAVSDPAIHLLNRITFGLIPDELAYVRQIGIDAYLEEQLNPETIDDFATKAKLTKLPLLEMDRRTLYSLQDYSYRAHEQLVEGVIMRGVHSKRQLFERVVDFWTDHFNVSYDDDNGADLILYHREAIRQHAFGKFRDLLLATAKHPAMLVYLDNFVNYAADPNENYARELLELHTLGVDGGYTEQDVVEVARAFTGWTIHNKTRDGFWFNRDDHDDDAKSILGRNFPADRGIEDGLHVLGLLANHPNTAAFISTKLAIRFVSDTPPQSLVQKMAASWQETDGEITAVLRSLFTSPEFAQSAGQKLRRPLEFFIGALRSSGSEYQAYRELQETVRQLGQLPFDWHPPNGYPDVAGAWMSTNGLLSRWNVAMQLTQGAYNDPHDTGWGIKTDLHNRLGNPSTVGQLVDSVATRIFGKPLQAANREAFIRYVAGVGDTNTAVSPALIAKKYGGLFGLLLASPLYQWR